MRRHQDAAPVQSLHDVSNVRSNENIRIHVNARLIAIGESVLEAGGLDRSAKLGHVVHECHIGVFNGRDDCAQCPGSGDERSVLIIRFAIVRDIDTKVYILTMLRNRTL